LNDLSVIEKIREEILKLLELNKKRNLQEPFGYNEGNAETRLGLGFSTLKARMISKNNLMILIKNLEK
jgi:hypothetical protein